MAGALVDRRCCNSRTRNGYISTVDMVASVSQISFQPRRSLLCRIPDERHASHGVLAAALFLPDLETIAQTPQVAAVHPSGPSISNHTLRISILFTAAVGADVLGHLHLLNKHGVEIQRAFLAQELWSPDRRELTLFFDPARLKVGVGKHDTLSLPLGAPSHVQLRLDAIPIKSWAVSSSNCLGMTPNQWAHVTPRGGTRGRTAQCRH